MFHNDWYTLAVSVRNPQLHGHCEKTVETTVLYEWYTRTLSPPGQVLPSVPLRGQHAAGHAQTNWKTSSTCVRSADGEPLGRHRVRRLLGLRVRGRRLVLLAAVQHEVRQPEDGAQEVLDLLLGVLALLLRLVGPALRLEREGGRRPGRISSRERGLASCAALLTTPPPTPRRRTPSVHDGSRPIGRCSGTLLWDTPRALRCYAFVALLLLLLAAPPSS